MVEKATDEDGGEQAIELDCQALRQKKKPKQIWLVSVGNNTDIKIPQLLLPLEANRFIPILR